MKFYIAFIPQPFDYNQPNFDPNKYDPEKTIRWRFNVKGMTDFKVVRDSIAPQPAIISFELLDCYVRFTGVYFWMFVGFGWMLYLAGMARVYAKFSRDKTWGKWLIALNSVVLLCFSFSFAEILI